MEFPKGFPSVSGGKGQAFLRFSQSLAQLILSCSSIGCFGRLLPSSSASNENICCLLKDDVISRTIIPVPAYDALVPIV